MFLFAGNFRVKRIPYTFAHVIRKEFWTEVTELLET
jgi:hypothetical protein